MEEFLNQYTGWNRQLDHENEEELTAIFESTTELSHSDLARMRFRPARSVNAAVVDSLMTAVAEGIENDSLLSSRRLRPAYKRLLEDDEHGSSGGEGGTAARRDPRGLRIASAQRVHEAPRQPLRRVLRRQGRSRRGEGPAARLCSVDPRADETISAAGAGKDLAGRDRGSRRDRLSRRVRGDRRSHPPRWSGR